MLKPWGDWSREYSAQRGRPAVPDHWTGRPGGSGAQPPLHLIYMVKVGYRDNSLFAGYASDFNEPSYLNDLTRDC